jgi:hypothetical protein
MPTALPIAGDEGVIIEGADVSSEVGAVSHSLDQKPLLRRH